MPDTRRHRGPHPEDAQLFAPVNWPLLRSAVGDLNWLLSRGYAEPSTLKLVGDRHSLNKRQRIAVMRCACSDQALESRRARELKLPDLSGRRLLLDGYNVITTVEAALAGGVLIVGRDGCYRDMASMHGTYRNVDETLPALEHIGRLLHQSGTADCLWYLDSPVSNSGRLKTAMLELAEERGWPWQVELAMNPDRELSQTAELVVTADSAILDACGPWICLAREVIRQSAGEVNLVDLSDAGIVNDG